MKSFIEAEMYNDGKITMYDLFKILRPDIHKYYSEIIHYDARFIIKEPNGKQRKLISIKHDIYANPPSELKLSARDKAIEDYVSGIGPRPINFKEEELNTEEGQFIEIKLPLPTLFKNIDDNIQKEGYTAKKRVNGIRVYTDNVIKNSFKIGNVFFGISGYLTDEEIKKLYEWVWLRGPAESSDDKNKKNNSKNMNFCLDLWTMQSIYKPKSSTNIRIVDLDLMEEGEPMFRNWKRIYKDFKTQNVILELE